MPKVGYNDFSRASLKALEYANTLQALALDNIRDQFAAGESELDFARGVSYEEFVKALTEATEQGKRDEFELFLAQRMGEAWTSFQQQQAQAAQQQGGSQQ